jgi:hypothetical protein
MFCRGLPSAQSQSDDAAGRSARDAVLVAKAPDSVDYDKRHIGLRVHEPPALTQASWFRAEDKEAVTVRDLIERRARDRPRAALGRPPTALDTAWPLVRPDSFSPSRSTTKSRKRVDMVNDGAAVPLELLGRRAARDKIGEVGIDSKDVA